MTKSILPSLTTAGVLAFAALGSPAFAQDSGALLDALVRKNVLSAQEAEDIRADLVRENAATTAGKIQLGSSVTEMKLSGDLRLRYQYDNRKAVDVNPDGPGVGFPQHGQQRSRERFRLRLNADFKLSDQFFGGVQLQTGSAADSANQTFGSGFGNYNIFISRAYLGWQATDWLTLVGGKQPNPFYTTDLVWDSDINPDGFSQRIDFHKLFAAGGSETVSYSDGKSISSSTSSVRILPPWELSLVAGQFIFTDNNEDAFDNDSSTDAWLFVTQLVGSYKFNSDVKLTVAPGYMAYTAADVTGVSNETSFNLAGGTRNLSIVTAPGDLAFKVAGLKAKVLWDFAYNTEGNARAREIYAMSGLPGVSEHSSRDNLAWLAGIQIGENKKKGDWSLIANYRQTGFASVDPNLNDSDFALGQLNTQGVKIGAAYNLTDFCVLAATYFDATSLRKNLYGGEATKGNKLAYLGSVRIFQLDLNVKF